MGSCPAIWNPRFSASCFESSAAEHAARMTAMDAATRNASELIDNSHWK